MKIFIDPPNSMILFDLVERFGHEPLSTMAALQEKIDNIEVDMPPMNVTLDDVVKGLKYAGKTTLLQLLTMQLMTLMQQRQFLRYTTLATTLRILTSTS